MIAAVDTLLKDIRNKRIAPVYLIHGDEPYYISRIADELEKVAIPAAERDFNQFILFGKDTDVGNVVNYARRYPFMAERQLVIVKEAQQLGGLGDKSAQLLLEEYALNPQPSSILMLCYIKEDGKPGLDERKAWVKSFGAKGKLLGIKKLYDSKIPDWVGTYCREQGVKISPKACQLLADHIGNDLKRLAGEIDKILINLHVGEEISATTVERFVGISKEYNVFELQKALMLYDTGKAIQIIDYFGRNPKDNPLVVILAQLFSFFSKVLLVQASKEQTEKALAPLLGISPYFVKDYLSAARTFPLPKVIMALHAIRIADARSKGIDAPVMNESDILRELIIAILK